MKVDWIATNDKLPRHDTSCWIVQQWGNRRWAVPGALYVAAYHAWFLCDKSVAYIVDVPYWAPYYEPELPPL